MPGVNGLATMQRTTVNLDKQLLREVEKELGTSGPTETVNAALAELVRREKLARVAEMSISQENIDADVLATIRKTGWR